MNTRERRMERLHALTTKGSKGDIRKWKHIQNVLMDVLRLVKTPSSSKVVKEIQQNKERMKACWVPGFQGGCK